jgi:uncharacterized protein YcaQ
MVARAAGSDRISLAEARRIALAAQGFGGRPSGRVDLRHARGVIDRVTLIQVDSVNVLCRSQELPLWARLGAHPRTALPSLIERAEIFEYWAHEASLLPVALQPLLRWRMAEARNTAWAGMRQLAKRDPGYVDAVRAEVFARGKIAARDLEQRGGKGRGSTSWWGWDDRKRALGYLFWSGQITAVREATTFERVYTPFEQLLPREILDTPTPSPDDARRELLAIAARSLGIATAADLADYFRIRKPLARPLIADLVAAGRLRAVTVDGWREAAYLDPAAPAPAAVSHRALLSPFDSLIWERRRTERLFDFHYRIEIYTPAEDRVHGYYVLPFLLDEALVARVDLKADRHAGRLLVHGAYGEPGAPAETASALAGELRAMAAWLGLDGVSIGRRGNLARKLKAAL